MEKLAALQDSFGLGQAKIQRVHGISCVKFQSQLEMMTQEKERLQTELKEANEAHKTETKEASRGREAAMRDLMAALSQAKDLEQQVEKRVCVVGKNSLLILRSFC